MEGDCPTFNEINRMPLTERVLRESMRILPASSYSQRMCGAPTSIWGVPLSRGTPVVFSQYVTHHMPELYAEPERFWPDRWLSTPISPYAYLPFGAGAKMCIGAPLAMTTLADRAALDPEALPADGRFGLRDQWPDRFDHVGTDDTRADACRPSGWEVPEQPSFWKHPFYGVSSTRRPIPAAPCCLVRTVIIRPHQLLII